MDPCVSAGESAKFLPNSIRVRLHEPQLEGQSAPHGRRRAKDLKIPGQPLVAAAAAGRARGLALSPPALALDTSGSFLESQLRSRRLAIVSRASSQKGCIYAQDFYCDIDYACSDFMGRRLAQRIC
jgi:hypothetical protein